MGATDFITGAVGKTAEEAFQKAVEQAEYEFGHAGYTGTIAEKNTFVMIEKPEDDSPNDYICKLLDNEDKRIADKWGPAGCIDLGPVKDSGLRRFVFFGWASS